MEKNHFRIPTLITFLTSQKYVFTVLYFMRNEKLFLLKEE